MLDAGSRAESEMANFIERRHNERVKEEGERALEAEWARQERELRKAQHRQNQAAWIEWHQARIRGCYERIAHHEREIERIQGMVPDGSTPRGGGILTHDSLPSSNGHKNTTEVRVNA
jgi:hypothetical protein